MSIKDRRLTSGCCKDTVNNAFILWCKTISIRGMSKLVRGPRILRSAWFIYVTGMTTFLAFVVAYLVTDYLKYDFTVQTRILLDHPSAFPAFTVCHQHPFSIQGFKLWESGQVMSPMKFNEMIKQLTLDYIKQKRFDAAKFVGLKDAVRLYYQSLTPEEARLLGHNYTIFRSCIRTMGSTLTYEQNCSELKGYKVTVHPHPKYFNCHTFEPIDEDSARETDSLALILGMGPPADEYLMEKTFLTSIFDQNEGLRVAVHEIGTFPDLVEYGLNVEPGKLNEISYTPTKRLRLHVSNRPCRAKNTSFKYNIMNMENFNYTQDLCLKLHVQNEIISECKCIYSLYPSETSPSVEIPYCERLYPSKFLKDWETRQQCLESRELSQTKRKYNGDPCVPNCEQYEYPHAISITKWHTHDWQLYWLNQLRAAMESLKDEFKANNKVNIEDTIGYKIIQKYVHQKNLTEIPTENKTEKAEENEYAFVVLKRLKNSTTEKTDKLNLSMPILWSRIGGLCSITIGLTAAVVFEILEFIYQMYTQIKAKRKNCTSSLKKRPIEKDPTSLTLKNCVEEDKEDFLQSSLFKLKRQPNGLYMLTRVKVANCIITEDTDSNLNDNGNLMLPSDAMSAKDFYTVKQSQVSENLLQLDYEPNIKSPTLKNHF